jgi:hypothetical protein
METLMEYMTDCIEGIGTIVYTCCSLLWEGDRGGEIRRLHVHLPLFASLSPAR